MERASRNIACFAGKPFSRGSLSSAFIMAPPELVEIDKANDQMAALGTLRVILTEQRSESVQFSLVCLSFDLPLA